MDAERKAELRNSAENALAVHDEGSIEWVHASRLLEALDALDAAEARAEDLAAERERLQELLARAYDIATSGMPDQDVPGEIAALLVEEAGDGR